MHDIRLIRDDPAAFDKGLTRRGLQPQSDALLVRDKALRDSLMGGTRGDIQESRRFFSEADWPKAVEMIRKGMSPAAALAALGYSASSMAGEQR